MALLKIEKITFETSSVSSFHFRLPVGFSYKSGQFVGVSIPIDGKIVKRSYSINTVLGVDDYFSITVKRLEKGLASNFLLDNYKAGDSLEICEAKGKFTFEANKTAARNLILIASGIGITPILSVLKSVLELENKSTVSLIYAVKHQGSVIFRKELAALASKFPSRFEWISVLSEAGSHWKGAKGRLSEYNVSSVLKSLKNPPTAETLYYLCLPPETLSKTKNALKKMQVPTQNIKSESWGSVPKTAIKPNNTTTSESNTITAKPTFQKTQTESLVSISLDGKTQTIKVPSNQNILQAALDAGLEMPHSCQNGVCSACKARCVSGTVEMTKDAVLNSEEKNQGFRLLCVSRPTSSVIGIVVE